MMLTKVLDKKLKFISRRQLTLIKRRSLGMLDTKEKNFTEDVQIGGGCLARE